MAYTTIDNPELYFQVKTYTGTGSSNALTLDGDENMQPDLVWIKERGGTANHNLTDSVRLATNYFTTNETDEEATAAETLKSFDSDGFTVGTSGGVNGSSDTYVAWCWKESADAGFDIVSYAGNATNRTISHSLSAVPHVMIMKNRTNAIKWVVYHHKNTSAPETDHLQLNDGAATSDDDSTWNDTAPTSSVFSLKTSTSVNGSSANYIAYLFTAKQGFSKFGSYTGNGSTDGPFVFCGFRPSWIMYKRTTDGSEGWVIQDNKVSPTNVSHLIQNANSSGAETDSSNANLDFLSNGFKLRHDDTRGNTSGKTYIYMAFAEAPFVNSNGVPCNAR